MDDSLKMILSKHWPTLVRYINPTSDLIDTLVKDKVLPAAMIDDVQKGSNRREKNEILLKSIKLRGNTSYRKFRDVLMKCGQIFIADLLFEEEGTMSFLEESDFTGFPALKLSLSPSALKQFVLLLDAKIRSRVLKCEWKSDSSKRVDLLLARAEDNKTQTLAQTTALEKEDKIKQLCAEINMKNDIIRSLSLDINILNAEVETFTERYTAGTDMPCNNSNSPSDAKSHVPVHPKRLKSPLSGGHNSQQSQQSGIQNNHVGEISHASNDGQQSQSSQSRKHSSRFYFFDHALSLVNSKLSTILGLPATAENDVMRIGLIESRTAQIQELVSRHEENIRRSNKDRDAALALLMPNTEHKFSTAVAGVQKYLMQEQRNRFTLLKDIDRLSRKLRGMSKPMPNSGLHALRQSAVTGKPSAENVDYRFLSNHIALVEADAIHIHKKLEWKDTDLKSLQSELANVRKCTVSEK